MIFHIVRNTCNDASVGMFESLVSGLITVGFFLEAILYSAICTMNTMKMKTV